MKKATSDKMSTAQKEQIADWFSYITAKCLSSVNATIEHRFDTETSLTRNDLASQMTSTDMESRRRYFERTQQWQQQLVLPMLFEMSGWNYKRPGRFSNFKEAQKPPATNSSPVAVVDTHRVV